MGGEIGSAFVVTVTRVRSQVASNLIGLHVQAGDGAVMQRISAYAAVAGRNGADPTTATGRGVTLLGAAVRSAAATQGVIDCFVVVGGLTALALLIVVVTQSAPIGPASHTPLFTSGRPRP
jgi:DHA2 family multidrug resistance protein